jgi:hypothetical protein
MQLSRADRSEFKAFLAAAYRHPADVLGVDRSKPWRPEALRERFMQTFASMHKQGGDHKDMQNLVSAYLLLLLFHSQNLPQATRQVINNNTLNVKADNITLNTQAFNREREALERRMAELREWGSGMNDAVLELDRRYKDQKKKTEALKEQLTTLAKEYDVAAKRSLCAPPYFDALHEFILSRCIQGEDERVSSEDFHHAFAVFLASPAHRGTAHPCQRDLRSLMEKLKFEYTQVYVNGRNARGFRGLGLRCESDE